MLRTLLTPLITLALSGTALTGAAVHDAGRDASATTATTAAAVAARAGLPDLLDLPGAEALSRGGVRGADLFPPVIHLPDGFAPEGVDAGYGTLLYAGSLQGGAIWRGDAVTGRGAVLVPAKEGQVALGVEVDPRGRVWVAGGPTGAARVYDGRSGKELASYQLLPPGKGIINDVVVTPTAAYFTDSSSATLQVVAIGRGGRLAREATPLPLTGDLEIVPGFNLNGIETTPDGKALLTNQTATGLLFRIDPTTGATTRVAGLADGALANGDGILRQGATLYVVRNQDDQIAVVGLDAAGTSGRITSTLTDSDLDVPTAVGLVGPFLYAVNARFGTPVTPTTRYDIVRVTRN